MNTAISGPAFDYGARPFRPAIKAHHWYSLVLLLTLAAAAPAHAFRCGTKLVSQGDTRSQVVAKCGEPTEVERRSVLREPLVWVGGRAYRSSVGLVEIPIEFWVYNLGPSKLMQRIRFEDGRVVEIESLGYGYIEPARSPPPPEEPPPRDDYDQGEN